MAQAFIHKHNLPQSYLETVANFIITNSKTVRAPSVNQNYVDPFTGSARYIPPTNGSNSSSGTNFQKSNQAGHESLGSNTFFPLTNYLKFEQANTATILSKYLKCIIKYL